MTIKETKVLNMELVEDFYKLFGEDLNNPNLVIMPNLKPILERVFVRIELDNMNPFEAIAVKDVATSSEIYQISESFDVFTNEESPVYEKANTLFTDLGKGEYDRKVFPIGCLRYAGHCILSGTVIFGLIRYSLQELFVAHSERTEKMPPSDLLKWNIETGFAKLIFNNWRGELTNREHYSDVYIESMFYSKISDKKSFILKEIRDHYGNAAKFIDTSRDDTGANIQSLKASMDSDIRVEFIGNTTLSTFFKLYLLLGDYGKILNHADYTKLSDPGTPSVDYGDTDDSSMKFQLNELCEDAFNLSNVNLYEKFLYIPTNRRIKYSFEISLKRFFRVDEINTLLRISTEAFNSRGAQMKYDPEWCELGEYFHLLKQIFVRTSVDCPIS